MVVRLFEPWVGGMERQARKLAGELVARGVDVEILTGRWFRGTPRREVQDGIVITRHHTMWEFGGIRGFRKLGGYLYLLTLVGALWRRRASTAVIHVHGCNYHAFGAVVAGRLTRTPVIVKLANSGHGSDLDKMRRGAQLALSGLMVPSTLRADRFVALNPQVRSELLAAGVEPERIVEIPNGVEDARPRASYEVHGVARVGFVGRLHAQKGLDTLLSAAARIRRLRPDLCFQLELLGEGPDERDLRTLAARLGIDDVVRFRGRCDDVLGELSDIDVFVLPSRAEGISNALLEAFSVGTPAVVSDLAGNRVVVEDGRNGLIVPVDEDGRLAAALIRLLDDAGLRERLGVEGRRTIERRFTISAVAGAYETLYDELAGPFRGLSTGSVGAVATASGVDGVAVLEET
jgi:glycosyltransferase involved in cell wall biosynthesis